MFENFFHIPKRFVGLLIGETGNQIFHKTAKVFKLQKVAYCAIKSRLRDAFTSHANINLHYILNINLNRNSFFFRVREENSFLFLKKPL